MKALGDFFGSIRHGVFWLPFILISLFFLVYVSDTRWLIAFLQEAQTFVLSNFSLLFIFVAVGFLAFVLVAMVHPFANTVIGGAQAKPVVSKVSWFAISLCTTLAAGILLWGAAEPLYHFHEPPVFQGIGSDFDSKLVFALSTLYFHWSIVPYAIFAIPTILFAIVIYNRGCDSTLSAGLSPVFGKSLASRVSSVVDSLCLFMIMAGVAASLATGIMVLSGSMEDLFGLESSPLVLSCVCALVVITFVISALSGLLRGIRFLSWINVILLVGLGVFFAIYSPLAEVFVYGVRSLLEYGRSFFEVAFPNNLGVPPKWSQDWTVFYWSSWIAWAPITALFLSRLTYGYRVRDVIWINFIYPSLFTIVLLTLIGYQSLRVDYANQFHLYQVLKESGPQAVLYGLLSYFPYVKVVKFVVLLAAFISFVTTADSTVEVITRLCLKQGVGGTRVRLFVKLAWGIALSALALIMIIYTGVDGLRILNNLGGFPALFLLLFYGLAFVRLLVGKAEVRGSNNKEALVLSED